MTRNITLMPGDGIGPEVVTQAQKVLDAINNKLNLNISTKTALIGGAAIDKYKNPLPDESINIAKTTDAILLGAVGGPKWDNIDKAIRPELGLLKLRKTFNTFANFRPAILNQALADASSLKPELVENLDLLIIRELTGGIYFGEPRGREVVNGKRTGFNTLIYNEDEVKRIAIVAFEAAKKRNKKLCSVDKANVLEASMLWRDVVNEVHKDFSDVTLEHMYVDNAAMQLVRAPKQFDVIVTSNMFGDILSDCAAMLTGSIGMLPSASLNENNFGVFEPVHGSAPDIAGQDKANPLATILSLAMLLRYSLNETNAADLIEKAVNNALLQGYRTVDIAGSKAKILGTNAMGDKIVALI